MRAPQPSGTNRPSSSLIFLRLLTRTGRCEPRCAALRARGSPPGGRNAAHRSAALAAGARPVPFRTRKLSRPAPMVLRGKPVGEQGAADRWTAFQRGEGPGGAIPRGPFPFRGALYSRVQDGKSICSGFEGERAHAPIGLPALMSSLPLPRASALWASYSTLGSQRIERPAVLERLIISASTTM